VNALHKQNMLIA